MTTTAGYPATMTELRGDPTHSSLWPNYGSSIHVANRLAGATEPGVAGSSSITSRSTRPRSDQTSNDQTSMAYGRYPVEDNDPYNPHPNQTVSSHTSYPNLKRSFSQTETPAYQEIVQDLRDDGTRMNASQDQKLLAFNKTPDKHTLTDQHGRVQQLDLSAQLHGMFFLSEMPSTPGDGAVHQPELTCYRRNLFQISGNVVGPRGQLSVITETGTAVPVNEMQIGISAIESVDGNPVRLIVIPYKTPPPNSPELSQTPDQEPPAVPLTVKDDSPETEGDFAVYPIGWRRLQFRIATANNGRRKELQQHFVLHLKVTGTLSDGNKVVLTESTTAPIVVRGRSPRNFQARKEIPLLGSSAGSRGQALMETGVAIVATGLGTKNQDSKERAVDLQGGRATFKFGTPKAPINQLGGTRSSPYQSWSPSGHNQLGQISSSSPSTYPATTIAAESYPRASLSGAPGYTTDSHELPLQTTLPSSAQLSLLSSDQQQSQPGAQQPAPTAPLSQHPLRAPFSYMPTGPPPRHPSLTGSVGGAADSSLAVPRYIDDSRPPKGPRRPGHESVHSTSSLSNAEHGSEYRYGTYSTLSTSAAEVPQSNYSSDPSTTQSTPARDYYPPPNTWATSSTEAASTVAYSGSDIRSYPFPTEQYKGGLGGAVGVKQDGAHTTSTPPAAYSTAPTAYTATPRASFDSVSNYSWGHS